MDGQLPCDTESSQDSRPLLPQRTSQGKKTSESRKKDQPSRSKRHQSSSKRQITQDYENVSVNPLSRSKTYVIHQSAFDLHQPRHTHQKRSLKHHGEMSQSCQSLSLRYTHAPQKVTTLFSPPAFDVLPTRNSATKSHGPSASYFSHLIVSLFVRVSCNSGSFGGLCSLISQCSVLALLLFLCYSIRLEYQFNITSFEAADVTN